MKDTNSVIDGLALFGRVCSSQGSCNSCPMSGVKQAGMSCTQFLATNPEVALSTLMNADNQTYTYFNELCARFPMQKLPIEVVAETFCRKAIFNGDFSCEDSSKCLECWGKQFVSDFIEEEEDTAKSDETDLSDFL